MTAKHKTGGKKKPQAKRVVTEIAPAVRVMLDAHMTAYNEAPERASSPLKYTDVINQALDEFLPSKPQPSEESNHGESEEGGEGKKGKTGKG